MESRWGKLEYVFGLKSQFTVSSFFYNIQIGLKNRLFKISQNGKSKTSRKHGKVGNGKVDILFGLEEGKNQFEGVLIKQRFLIWFI